VSAARSRILDRVRRGLATATIPSDWRSSVRGVPTDFHGDATMLRDRFVRELTALGVNSFIVDTPEQVCRRVVEIAGADAVFAWDRNRLPYGVGDALGPNLVTADASRDEQAAASLGITGCHGAIAETGSIAVLSGAGMPRAASLLPPTHLCIVRSADLYPSMGAFFRAQAAAIAGAACCTFITGPSRTADIELTLTLGVHGPGAVVVVIGP